jgi:hypothetical protein
MNSNPLKGVRSDSFWSIILKYNDLLSQGFTIQIAKALLRVRIPGHLKETRLVKLRNYKGSTEGSLDDMRPIAVRPHQSKIMEKAILTRMFKPEHQHLI